MGKAKAKARRGLGEKKDEEGFEGTCRPQDRNINIAF